MGHPLCCLWQRNQKPGSPAHPYNTAVEYPIDDDGSPVPTARRRESPRAKGFYSTVRVLLTAVAIPVLVSIITSFYVNTRLLRPKLKTEYSLANIWVMPVKDHTNEFTAAVLDMYPAFVPTPDNHSGVEIVLAKRLTFKSSADYIINYPLAPSLIYKIMLTNDGYVTANHVNLGLLGDATNSRIIASPNVKFSQEGIPDTGVNSSFMRVEIERLGPGERALLTVVTDPRPDLASSAVDPSFVKVHKGRQYRPLLYLSCAEGTGMIASDPTTWREVTRWEETNFPGSATGFWTSRLQPRSGVSPLVEDLKELEIPYYTVDDSGKTTLRGSWKLPAGPPFEN